MGFFFFSNNGRSSGPGAGGEGGRPAGASAGGAEDLREEEEASQTSHVPQDAYEDHRSEKHQRERLVLNTLVSTLKWFHWSLPLAGCVCCVS